MGKGVGYPFGEASGDGEDTVVNRAALWTGGVGCLSGRAGACVTCCGSVGDGG